MAFPVIGTIASDDQFLRMRALPNGTAAVVGHVRNGARVKLVAEQRDDQNRLWYQVEMSADVLDLFSDESLTQPVRLTTTGWCAGWLIRTAAVPELQPVVALPEIGLNVLDGGPVAVQALTAGCRAIQPSFNPGHARELKKQYADRHIVVRPAMWGGASLSFWMEKTELNSLPAGTIVLGLNENDCGLPPDSPKNILDRAHFDEAAWNECKKRGLAYAGGGLAVASADMTNPSIVQAFRDYYAPLFNAGMWFNLHCYMARDGSGQGGPGVPLAERFTKVYPHTMHGKTVTIRQSYWTAEWWRWFPLFCGFDPRKSKFMCDEMGLEGTVEMVDAPNSGGFRANPQVDMIKYLKDWQRCCSLPVLFGDDMQEYPSNLLLGLIFCANSDKPDSKWYGYDVTDRIGEIGAAFWRTSSVVPMVEGEGGESITTTPRGAAQRATTTKPKKAKKAKKTPTPVKKVAAGRKTVSKGKSKGKGKGAEH